MTLARQLLGFGFGQGLDTKTDATSVPAGRFLLLENAVFTHPKSARKRNGFARLGNGIGVPAASYLSVGQAIATYQNELLVADAGNLYSYDSANDSLISKGAFVSVNVTQTAVQRDTYQQTGQDSAIHSTGLQAFAWEDTQGGSRYSVIDGATGQTIVPKTLINANAIKPKVFALGGFLLILYVNTSDSRIYAAPIPVGNPTAALVPVAVTASAGNRALNSVSPNYDASVITTAAGQRLYVAWNDATGGPGGISAFYSTAATPTTFATAVSLVGEAGTVVNVFADLYNKCPVFAYWNGTAVKARAYDAGLTTSLGTPTIETVANVVSISGVSVSSTSVNLKVFYSVSAASTYNYLTRLATLTQPYGPIGTVWFLPQPFTSPGYMTTTAPAVYLRSAALFGKAFNYSNTAYVPLVYQSPLQPTYFVADGAGNIVAKILYSNGGPIPTRSDGKGSVVLAEVNNSGTSYQMAVLAKTLLTTQSGQVYTQTGVSSATLNFYDTQNSYLRAALGNNLHFSGGFLWMYDGIGPVEHGFHLYPEPITVAAVGSGGSLTAGVYQVSVCYEWTDNQGQVHRSAPSIAKSVTAVNSDSLTVTVPTLRLTAKQARSAPSVVVYRTTANGTVFFQDSSITSPTKNDNTVDTVTFTSTQSDTSIQGNPLLYTTGFVVENIPPNATSSMCVHRNRIFALDTTTGQVAFSKQTVPGAPVEFQQGFALNIDPRGGTTTAVASMDDKLIVFKSTSIFFHLGQGPDATGGQNDFTDSIFITSDAGCTNPRSVVLTPAGLIFQSAKGIYLLDRALRASYIGADVEAYNSQAVTSGQLIPNTNQIRLTLAGSSTWLVYDYFVGQWSVFTPLNAVDSVLFQNQMTFLTPSGGIYKETPGVFSDAGQFIKIRAQTSWLQFAEVQGFQRVRRAFILGDYVSAHQLRIQVAYNFNPSSTQDVTITPSTTGSWGSDSVWGGGGGSDSTVWGGITWAPYQYRLAFNQQKCEALQLTIEDVYNGTVGEAVQFSSLAFEVGIKSGGFKLPAAQTTG